MKNKSRNKNEVIADFLKKTLQHPDASLTRICSYSGVGYGKMKKFVFVFVTKHDLVDVNIDSWRTGRKTRRVRITQAGLDWLKDQDESE